MQSAKGLDSTRIGEQRGLNLESSPDKPLPVGIDPEILQHRFERGFQEIIEPHGRSDTDFEAFIEIDDIRGEGDDMVSTAALHFEGIRVIDASLESDHPGFRAVGKGGVCL